MRLSVGTRVMVATDPERPNESPNFISEMRPFCGKVVTISGDGKEGCYRIDEDGGRFRWHARWLTTGGLEMAVKLHARTPSTEDAAALRGEQDRLQAILNKLTPAEAEAAQDLNKRYAELTRRIHATEGASLDLDFLAWPDEHGLPRFAAFGPESETYSILIDARTGAKGTERGINPYVLRGEPMLEGVYRLAESWLRGANRHDKDLPGKADYVALKAALHLVLPDDIRDAVQRTREVFGARKTLIITEPATWTVQLHRGPGLLRGSKTQEAAFKRTTLSGDGLLIVGVREYQHKLAPQAFLVAASDVFVPSEVRKHMSAARMSPSKDANGRRAELKQAIAGTTEWNPAVVKRFLASIGELESLSGRQEADLRTQIALCIQIASRAGTLGVVQR